MLNVLSKVVVYKIHSVVATKSSEDKEREGGTRVRGSIDEVKR